MDHREELLLKVIHLMAEKFKDRIVLEGGMLLRLLGCPRSTQDVDCILLSDESKKILAERITRALAALEGVRVEEVSLNSRGIFIRLSSGGPEDITAMLEVSVAAAINLPTDHLSTVALANTYSQRGRIVTTMALPEAFANKIASALERDTLRDLYDLFIFEPLCAFDKATLARRLRALSIGRKKPKATSFPEAAAMLKERADRITARAVREELAPLLPPRQAEGIETIIKAAVVRITEKLARLEQ